MPKETQNEIVKKTSTPPPAMYQEPKTVVDSADILVPRILLGQVTSPAVIEQKAKLGDFVNSLTGEVVAGPNKELTFIPITMKKYWRNFEVVQGKETFRSIEPFDLKNYEREETKNGATWKHYATIDLFGFTEDDAKDRTALPSVISFTSYGYKAGQKASTIFAGLDAALDEKGNPSPIPYHTYMMSISCIKKQNNKGTFYMFDLSAKRDGGKPAMTPQEYMPKILTWSKILKSTKRIVTEDIPEVENNSVDESRF